MTRATLSRLAVVLAGAAAWLVFRRSAAEHPGSAPDSSPGAGLEAGHTETAGPTLHAGVPAAPSDQTPDDERSPRIEIVARAVDERRRPVAGATVIVRLLGEPLRSGRTSSDGISRVDATWSGRMSARPEGAVYATDSAGRAGVAALTPPLTTVVIAPSFALEIRVRDGAAPVAGATVRSWHHVLPWSPGLRTVDGRTDQFGIARLEGLPRGMLSLLAESDGRRARADTTIPRPASEPLTLSLSKDRTLDVFVTEEKTGRPLPGMTVTALQVRTFGERMTASTSFPFDPPLHVPPTDAAGHTRIEGLSEQDRILLAAYPATSPTPSNVTWSEQNEVAPGVREARIAVPPRRSFTWQVLPGESPVPADASAIRVRGFVRGQVLPATGTMHGSTLVLEGVGPEDPQGIAQAPDGSLALLLGEGSLAAAPTRSAREPATGGAGAPTSFAPPRRLDVRVTAEGGAALAGVIVTVDAEGIGRLVDAVPTDASGAVVFQGLPATRVSVRVRFDASPASEPILLGIADLGERDGRLDVTVPAARVLDIQVRIHGAARLPPTYSLSLLGQRLQDVEEDPDAGTLRVRVRPPSTSANDKLWLRAPGFVPSSAPIEWAPAGSPTVIPLDLEPAGVVVGRVVPPSVPDEWGLAIYLQRQKADGGWERVFLTENPNGAALKIDGVYRCEPLPTGSFRLWDDGSGVHGATVHVAAGETVDATLDLSDLVIVKGRVEVPAIEIGTGIHIVVEGPGIDFRDYDAAPDSGPGREYVGQGGRFQVNVPGSRGVVLRPWHPVWVPAETGGSVVVTGPRDDVVLRLVEGTSASFRTTLPDSRADSLVGGGGRVLLFTDKPEGTPLVTCPFVIERGMARFAGFRPGTYTLWIDQPPWSPRVIEHATLLAGHTDLGSLDLDRGSAVRIRPHVREGQALPRLEVFVTRLDEPIYRRRLEEPYTDPVVPGLGPGRFQVAVYRRFAGDARPVERTVTLDGRGEATIEIDYR